VPDVRDRLRESLKAALKDRDEVATAALRTALSAIANAEAVPPAPWKSRLGVGAGEAARRELSDADVIAILRAEVEEKQSAASVYERLGESNEARRLRAEAEFLHGLVLSAE
jgi:uncharacterized protein YqeY